MPAKTCPQRRASFIHSLTIGSMNQRLLWSRNDGKRKPCQLLLVFAASMNRSRLMAGGLQLSQRLTQSLVLAPQLQQSLALLQAPTLELKALVEQELQQNPVLEETAEADGELREREAHDEDGPADSPDPAEPPADLNVDPATD